MLIGSFAHLKEKSSLSCENHLDLKRIMISFTEFIFVSARGCQSCLNRAHQKHGEAVHLL